MFAIPHSQRKAVVVGVVVVGVVVVGVVVVVVAVTRAESAVPCSHARARKILSRCLLLLSRARTHALALTTSQRSITESHSNSRAHAIRFYSHSHTHAQNATINKKQDIIETNNNNTNIQYRVVPFKGS